MNPYMNPYLTVPALSALGGLFAGHSAGRNTAESTSNMLSTEGNKTHNSQLAKSLAYVTAPVGAVAGLIASLKYKKNILKGLDRIHYDPMLHNVAHDTIIPFAGGALGGITGGALTGAATSLRRKKDKNTNIKEAIFGFKARAEKRKNFINDYNRHADFMDSHIDDVNNELENIAKNKFNKTLNTLSEDEWISAYNEAEEKVKKMHKFSSFIDGFTKRAKQRGLNNQEIEALTKHSGFANSLIEGIESAHNYIKPHVQYAQKSLVDPDKGLLSPALQWGKENIVQPMKDIPSNYNSMLENHRLAKSMANVPFEAQAHQDAAKEHLMQLLRGIGTGTAIKGGVTAGLYGAHKMTHGQDDKTQPAQLV